MREPNKPLLKLLIFLFCFSCLLPLGAPTPRMLHEAPVQQGMSGAKEMEMMDEFVKGKMEFEINDYPGSGANSRHDPRGPGRD